MILVNISIRGKNTIPMPLAVARYHCCLPLRGPKEMFKILESYKYAVISNYLDKGRL
jgi:hypothetical protein